MERGRELGFALACRVREPDGRVVVLMRGGANGVALTEGAYRQSKEQAHEQFRMDWPEAEIVYLTCQDGLTPEQMASAEAERRVRAWL